jgi:hypothetical protein
MLNIFFPDLKNKDKTAAGVLLMVALVMLIIEYFGIQKSFYGLNKEFHWFLQTNQSIFWAQVYTSVSFTLWLFICPLLISNLISAENKSITGLGIGESRTHFKYYILILLFIIPFMYFVSSFPSFYKFYPLYQPTSFQDLLFFESVYLVQFIGTEFFFRGWPLLQLNKIWGKVSIFVMIIPYSLIHIHKPAPEAFASILAGIVLGNLAIKTQSIWPGVLLHTCVALSVDVFSLIHSGKLAAFF